MTYPFLFIKKSNKPASRMGYSLSDAEDLSDTFTIYKNVGDGIKDIEQASSSVISTMKAFGIEASNSMSIVDKFNEVSNTFAVRSDEIGLAVADMGSAWSSANNTLDETIAVYTAMNEITQDWSKSSTAMRTIAARLRNTAGALDEMGVDSDGAAESVTKLQQQLSTITDVNIMKSATEFKSTTQILRELSAVWDDLTDKDRADVTRLVAGTRQQSTFSAIMKNFEQVDKAVKTSEDSFSSAEKENAKYLDSINGRISQFKASYEALSKSLVDDGAIKSVVSGGTDIVNVLDTIIGSIGSIPALAALAVGAISGLTHKGKLKSRVLLCPLQSGGNAQRVKHKNGVFNKRLYSKYPKWCA